ncbi:2Fe-2S iron-sulfur cluster-binding protein [Acuticoccus sp. MNP-M23]|uniref:2Fe-2S iron-sulfur cluster-binding protein n=1 Tax=Acuticoccus sp. MNP-M23 TaxID=3072793 RepID=UPI002815DAD6|nr:2Fe-2S iron-sulfur cluster-binding protein [Acuticoccus sp. MNP-M23]WMS41138.1 2Fe-2S iron-sulfur cluster-binding protein [Acuticoccus sp. MNP-M23]
MKLALSLNGDAVSEAAEPRTNLADFVRETCHKTGTHVGCEQGVCGACTVFVDGRPVRSCITLAAACEGAAVHTIEGFEDDALMAQLRQSFSAHHALQCGYCTPGMLVTAYDIVRRLPDADTATIRRELSGNLCRCTGYAGIVAAIEAVLAESPPPAAVQPLPRQRRAKPSLAATGTAKADTAVPAAQLEEMEPLTGGTRLTRSLAVEAPLAKVWAVLTDLDAIADCIPGAKLGTPPEGSAGKGEPFAGAYKVALGPVTATFRGAGLFCADAADHTGKVVGRGRDPLSGTRLSGELAFAAAADGDTTRLDLDMTYLVKGPLAQFSRPALVEALADSILADTADALAARARGESAPAPQRAASGLSFLRIIFARLFGRKA